MNGEAISDYYDKFRKTRMSRYRILGNRRLALAARRASALICDGDVIADFGCGIGIVAEEMSRAGDRVQVVAVDISGANIDYAKRTVKRRNVEFHKVGLSEGCAVLKEQHPNGYDVITLIDVIEHIETAERPGLLAQLTDISADDAYLLLTYPSPEYQRYLTEHQPDELQIIDNALERDVLLSEAAAAGWTLKSFQYVDVWMSNQYIHAIFQKGDTPFDVKRIRRAWFREAGAAVGVALRFPFRVWRYGWPSLTSLK